MSHEDGNPIIDSHGARRFLVHNNSARETIYIMKEQDVHITLTILFSHFDPDD